MIKTIIAIITFVELFFIGCTSFQGTIDQKGKPDYLLAWYASTDWRIYLFYDNNVMSFTSDSKINNLSFNFESPKSYWVSSIADDQKITSSPGNKIIRTVFLKKLYDKYPVLEGSNTIHEQIMLSDDLSILISQAGLPLTIENRDAGYPNTIIDGEEWGKAIRVFYPDAYYDMIISHDGSFSMLEYYNSNFKDQGITVSQKQQNLPSWFYNRYPKLKKVTVPAKANSLQRIEAFANKTHSIMLISKTEFEELSKAEAKYYQNVLDNESATIEADTRHMFINTMVNISKMLPSNSKIPNEFKKFMEYYNKFIIIERKIDRAVSLYNNYQKLLDDPSSIIKSNLLMKQITPKI